MIKTLLVFDIDGTLTNSVNHHFNAFFEALQLIGIKDLQQEWRPYKHHTDSYISRFIYEELTGLPFSNAILKDFENHLTKGLLKQDRIGEIEGARDFVISAMKHPDFMVCFATGSMYEPAIIKLDQANIPYEEELVVTANSHETREGIVEQAIVRAKKYYMVEDFNRIIAFGDGLWDLKTAQNLDLEFIGLGVEHKNLLKENGAEICWDNFVGKDITDLFVSTSK